MIRRLWNERVVPWTVERCCSGSSIERQRDKIVPLAAGRVLDLGVGSGLNLSRYDGARVEGVVGLDPSDRLLEMAGPRADAAPFPVDLRAGSAERLPFEDASFDTVVVTYALCSIPDERRALREVRRVLRSGGVLLLSEHGLAPDPGPAGWQRRLDPVWHRLGGGCHLDRAVSATLAAEGFAVDELESMYLPGPRWLNWHTWGRASLR